MSPSDATPVSAPFALTPEDRRWVERTLAGLPTEQRIAQLFILSSKQDSIEEMRDLARLRPGGIHRFPGSDLDKAWAATCFAIQEAEIPVLISGDLEGGMTSYGFSTPIPNQLGIAACDDLTLSEDLAALLARESAAMGCNWSFTPVADINAAFRSAVVGTRSYGSDVGRVLAQARSHIRALQANGIAATVKHWPGEGFDDRDQHLATTVNPLGMDQWEASFGRIYRTLIEDGVMSIMSAHIALPAFVRSLNPDAGREAFRPASISRLLNQTLLRERLGFKGMIVSDATVMGGLTSWAERAEAAPAVIESGCDAFLFSRDPASDMAAILDGLRAGRLSEARLDEAVRTMLSFKAALGLHRRALDERLPPLEAARAMMRTPAHMAIAEVAAGKSPTLVKDSQELLPLHPDRHRRVVVIAETGESFFDGAVERSLAPFCDLMRGRGFELRDYDPSAPPTRADTDLVLYLVGQEATPGLAHIFLDWTKLHGSSRNAMIRFNREIPTMLISFGQPYYLYDAPATATCVNAYCAIETVQRALVPRLLGELPFSGVSPVDPFCGQEDLRW